MEDGRTYVLAPLAGYTDLPYREACRAQGAHFMYTALIDSGALVHGNRENENILKRGKDEPWLGVQLLGSIPEDVRKSAAMLDAMDYDALDFNMGCPMQKVIKRPAGAALLYPENHALAFECVSIMRELIRNKPFTVKIRVLDAEDPEPTVDFCRKLEALGVDGITIHGRIAKMIYAGPVATHVIRNVRENVKIPVTANGGIFSLETADCLAAETGCDRLMVARGSLGNPWIFRELLTRKKIAVSTEDLCDTMARQVWSMIEMYGERKALLLGRKLIVAYLRGRGYSKQFRIRGSAVATAEEFRTFIADLRQTQNKGGS